ncbi:MAG: HD family hydrolase [Pseudomonadota bacterium]
MPQEDGAPRAWQRMLSGRRLDLVDPSPLDIEISDVAHGLARVARWNGQTTGRYAFSVAQHSLIVEKIFSLLRPKADADARLTALLHDAPEYVIGDLISPFKSLVGGDYRNVEHRLERAVHLRFSLPSETPQYLKSVIKRADSISAYYEAVLLAGFSENEARKLFGRPRGISRDTLSFEPLPATTVQKNFLKRFEDIEARRTLKTAHL